jgi:hypothetical protein
LARHHDDVFGHLLEDVAADRADMQFDLSLRLRVPTTSRRAGPVILPVVGCRIKAVEAIETRRRSSVRLRRVRAGIVVIAGAVAVWRTRIDVDLRPCGRRGNRQQARCKQKLFHGSLSTFEARRLRQTIGGVVRSLTK